MPVYLSPGVFPREIDLSVLPSAVGPLRPAFIGTAKKGPLNTPVFITTSQQAIDTFGEPFAESYMMYAMLAYLEEGNECYGMRVAIECEEGQDEALADVCIDTSGAKGNGWGRVPLFTGIDNGRINLRAEGDNGFIFHDASATFISYEDAEVSTTEGPTSASLSLSGSYTGDIDDSFVLLITGAPDVSSGAPVGGANFQLIRNSDGEIVLTGELVDDNDDGVSNPVSVGNGISFTVTVSAGVLDVNDAFYFEVEPNNRSFSIAVDTEIETGATGTVYTMPVTSVTTINGVDFGLSVSDFVDEFNGISGVSGEEYLMVEYTLEDGSTIPQLRTKDAGKKIQISTTNAWALEVGSEQYAWDIPRSYLIGTDPGPYTITTSNNRIRMNVIDETVTNTVDFNVPIGANQTAASVAAAIDVAGVVGGNKYWNSFALTQPNGDVLVVIETDAVRQFATLQLMASYSNLKTLRFAEEVNIIFPYKRAYRGYSDNRLTLPAAGEITASNPLSCEADPASAQCDLDSAYFENIVGWFVAPSPGTWVDGYTVTIEVYTEALGDAAGRFKVTIKDANGQVLDILEDVSFDKREDRYVANIVNPGTRYGGATGNLYVNWEERPAYLNNDVNDLANYVVRQPSQINSKAFSGQTNGIPLDPAYSSELDSAVIGNPALSTGIYAFQNPESYDINVLTIPGFSSGAVIGTALQMCEGRGDVIFLVDPPFGLRPQQVVDWHNGMLLSDLNSAINSSYGALYWSWVRIFDQFSGEEVWIPPSGHVAAVFSRTARVAEQWTAPAGLRRGRLLTALDVEYSPSQGERDLLYGSRNSVNPIVRFPQDGITIWGQKTLQRRATVLDRVNVRMLLIYLKKNAIQILRNYIFEPNDQALWTAVRNVLESFVADVAARRGLSAFKVVVDATNNTPERIDRNELWVSIFLKPTPTAEFVVLNLVTLRTGASFSADEALAAAGVVQVV